MLLYAATYPRCGSGVLRWLLLANFDISTCSEWAPAPGDRERLAAAGEVHSVKTHAPPPAEPLAGEAAIQLIRHPGRAIASHFLLNQSTKARERPLKRFIAGQRRTGDWTSYHRAWSQTSMPLLRLRYEDVTADPSAAVAEIARFLGRPAPETVVAETPEQAHARNPLRNPAASPDAWRDLIQGKDLERLRKAHQELAAEWGYSL
jgi:hypothetical protein